MEEIIQFRIAGSIYNEFPLAIRTESILIFLSRAMLSATNVVTNFGVYPSALPPFLPLPAPCVCKCRYFCPLWLASLFRNFS